MVCSVRLVSVYRMGADLATYNVLLYVIGLFEWMAQCRYDENGMHR